jgi:arabinose-5-phosphate isomerase
MISFIKDLEPPESLVDVLLETKGHVIITGMGKSGHIARKISSTLSSIGCPSFFLHPAEASHGDLGMITSHDSLLILSNSGETRELLPIIQYCLRFHINIASITSNPDSFLAANSVSYLLPEVKEPFPTISTTLMLIVGDALAMELCNRNRFENHAFRRFHPGGALGNKSSESEEDAISSIGGVD